MSEGRLNQVLEKIAALQEKTWVVAIDGRCGSGKSTLAAALSSVTGAGIIHMDDFFLPPVLRTEERLKSPGGNVHYERFCEEVLPYLKVREELRYRRFDCSRMELADWREVRGAGRLIVEGAYSCHPVFGQYMNLKVFSDAPREIRLERILKRSGSQALKNFKERWIPMEEAYFRAFHIREQADIII